MHRLFQQLAKLAVEALDSWQALVDRLVLGVAPAPFGQQVSFGPFSHPPEGWAERCCPVVGRVHLLQQLPARDREPQGRHLQLLLTASQEKLVELALCLKKPALGLLCRE